MTDTAERVETQTLQGVVIRFAGDSGDGMQLTGDRFTSASAIAGNDLVTMPDFPAEIRAPQGTIAGVSAFQIHISDHAIHTPGDEPDVLVAMNPAALMSELERLKRGGTIILNSDAFDERNLAKCGYTADPRHDGTLSSYIVHEVPMNKLTVEATASLDAKKREAERSKNFFALGLVTWMYSRPTEPTLDWIDQKFGKNPNVVAANKAAFHAGHAFGETAEMFGNQYVIESAPHEPGTYTNITGNIAMAWGMVAAGQLAKLPIFLGSYPITPASDILHELSNHKNFGVRTFQAEDEIAGAGSALGAAFGGHLAYTTTSGPGVSLKGETISLAAAIELPLVVIDIQRGGPSTGLPTKTEASDLMLALYGRHGESPLPVVAAYSPSHCFHMAIEASRIALKYRTPVILLSDGYLANGAEPWKLPDVTTLPDISVDFTTTFNDTDAAGNPVFHPYKRDEDTLARPWAVPGTPGLEHRVGGLERADVTGNVNYTPHNHGRMTDLRQSKLEGMASDFPDPLVNTVGDANILLIGWGSTHGSITASVERLRDEGHKVDHVHLTHLNPLPTKLAEMVQGYEHIMVPELNLGQLIKVLRAEYLIDAKPISKVTGLPFTGAEIVNAVTAHIAGGTNATGTNGAH